MPPRRRVPAFFQSRSSSTRFEKMLPSSGDARDPGGTIEIDLAGGHRMRINGRYDPEALARLIRGLSG